MATVTVQRARKRKRTTEPAGVRLPDHLVAEVLLRMPARSLVRLRSTCRTWNAEISSRGFQERHHALAAAKTPKLALLKYAPPHTYTLQSTRRGRPGGTYMVRCADCPRVIGSKACCGLVLIGRRCRGRRYYVCNPTTGEVLRLPRSHQLHCAIGLGFHAPSREFKVVQIIISSSQLQATVLTVCDARGWRLPASASLVGFTAIEIDNHVVLADGCLHWSFKAEKPHGHGIIAFSLADESFRLVPQPPSVDGDKELRPVGNTLAELDGRLCMMRDLRHRSDVGSLLFEIWKLQDYATGTWSLDYRVDLTHMADRLRAPWLVVPLSYLDGGAEKRKLLLATTAQGGHIYDPGSGTLQTVACTTDVGGDTWDEDDEEVNSVRLLLYQESLVRFPRMKKGKGRIGFLQLEL